MNEEELRKMIKGYSIKNWSEEDRPREKMLKKGNGALSDLELITILIGSGNPGKSAMDLANEVLSMGSYNLAKLGRLSAGDFQRIKGIGLAKGITLAAALELGRRRQLSEVINKKIINNSQSAADILMPLMSDLVYESFCIMCLTTGNKLMHYEFVSSGGLTSTVVDVRLILKIALLHMASRLVIAHNHPSGSLNPSKADEVITEKIKNAASLMDIHLVDHIIIAEKQYFSFADNGLL